MAKPAVTYACTDCGYSAGRWFGKCPGCNAFGTLIEEVVAFSAAGVSSTSEPNALQPGHFPNQRPAE